MISYCRHCKGYTTHLSSGCVWASDPRNPHKSSLPHDLPTGGETPAPTGDRATDASGAQTRGILVRMHVPVEGGKIMCRVGADMCPLLALGAPYPYCRESGASLLRQCGADRVERVHPHRGCFVRNQMTGVG